MIGYLQNYPDLKELSRSGSSDQNFKAQYFKARTTIAAHHPDLSSLFYDEPTEQPDRDSSGGVRAPEEAKTSSTSGLGGASPPCLAGRQSHGGS